MQNPWTRRDVLAAGGIGGIAMLGIHARADGTSPVGASPAPAGDTSSAWPGFPHVDPKLTAEVVGKSHFDEKRVRELVGMHPALVNAWWDWGFGDWESPLGAASHTGRRAIAEFLIERGARIDIFAAAMLGYTDVVRAFVTAQPGVQRTLGPHAITLLAHAEAGGGQASDTFEYLKSLDDAGIGVSVEAISEEARKKYMGTYSYGPTDAERFEIKTDSRGNLVFQRGTESMRIHSVGNDEFFPAGVPTTRFKFELSKTPSALSITAGPNVVLAVRS